MEKHNEMDEASKIINDWFLKSRRAKEVKKFKEDFVFERKILIEKYKSLTINITTKNALIDAMRNYCQEHNVILENFM